MSVLDGNVPEGDAKLEERWASAVGHLRALEIEGDPPDAGEDRHDAWLSFMTDLEAVVVAAARELRFERAEIGQ